MSNCPYCGLLHTAICHRVKAIEYDSNGVTVRRVEFHGPVAGAEVVESSVSRPNTALKIYTNSRSRPFEAGGK